MSYTRNNLIFHKTLLFLSLLFFVANTGSVFATNNIPQWNYQNTSDRDADDIPDSEDACPDEGDWGNGLDDYGCPLKDTDGDGVFDRNDACVNRGDEYGLGIQADGCPITDTPDDVASDRDSDGFADSEDACPDEGDWGNGLDADGCPFKDTDGDGVFDRNDACVNRGDEYGLGVQANGCPVTPSNNSGASNSDDTSDTPPADNNVPPSNNNQNDNPAPVSDRDGDGYPDSADACPDESDWGRGLDGNGCPYKDTDGDGVNDRDDACPYKGNEGGLGIDDEGCPYYDTDGDRVIDRYDTCPRKGDEAGLGVDRTGCPYYDRDWDGFYDRRDACPNEGDWGHGIDNTGCPYKDTDGDGMFDRDDACPRKGNEGGVGIDDKGCPNYDRDWDGFYDRDDACPNEGDWGLGLDDTGCPYKDTDGDGMFDRYDTCPRKGNEGGRGIDDKGCPYYDRDWDGFYDRDDVCPSRADEYGYGVDHVGCPAVESDGDGILDHLDNCPLVANPGQEDVTGDGVGDACDDDFDDDGFKDDDDNCPLVWNVDQHDENEDGLGDECSQDFDGDRVFDIRDNCPRIYNPGQADADFDGIGNACDTDIVLAAPATDSDDDGIPDLDDNCPAIANPEQKDVNLNGAGDACEDPSLALDPSIDGDADGVPDSDDNCATIYNPDQADNNGNNVGNACESDVDQDGIYDYSDNCPVDYNPGQQDSNADSVGDACDNDGDGVVNALDNCPEYANVDQTDKDHNGVGDICQFDTTPLVDPVWKFLIDEDNDNIPDWLDVCPGLADDGTDSDGDGRGDACDDTEDMDKDGILDGGDNCPLIWNPDQVDSDDDGTGDLCSFINLSDIHDVDGDGHSNINDNCPSVANALQLDRDGNGIGDDCQGVFNTLVPFTQTSEFDCLAAAICTAQSPFGTTNIDCVSNTTTLMQTLGYMTEEGAPIDSAVPILEEIGLNSDYRTDMTWDDLQTAIDNDQPVIVPVQKLESGAVAHALTIIDMTDDTVTVVDSKNDGGNLNAGEVYTLTKAEFESYWTGEAVVVDDGAAQTTNNNFVSALALALTAALAAGAAAVVGGNFAGTNVKGGIVTGPGISAIDGVTPILGTYAMDRWAPGNTFNPYQYGDLHISMLGTLATYYYAPNNPGDGRIVDPVYYNRIAEFNGIPDPNNVGVGRPVEVPVWEWFIGEPITPPIPGESEELKNLREARNNLAQQVSAAYKAWDEGYRNFQRLLKEKGRLNIETMAAYAAMIAAARALTSLVKEYAAANEAFWEKYVEEFPPQNPYTGPGAVLGDYIVKDGNVLQSPLSGSEWNQLIDSFNVESDWRYTPWRNGTTYCNIFAADVVNAVEGYGKIYHDFRNHLRDEYPLPAQLSNGLWLGANNMVRWLRGDITSGGPTAAQRGWTKVSKEDAVKYANEGFPTVVGWNNPGGIGHMGLLRAGNDPATPTGQLKIAQAGATNFSNGNLQNGFGNRSVEFFVYIPRKTVRIPESIVKLHDLTGVHMDRWANASDETLGEYDRTTDLNKLVDWFARLTNARVSKNTLKQIAERVVDGDWGQWSVWFLSEKLTSTSTKGVNNDSWAKYAVSRRLSDLELRLRELSGFDSIPEYVRTPVLDGNTVVRHEWQKSVVNGELSDAWYKRERSLNGEYELGSYVVLGNEFYADITDEMSAILKEQVNYLLPFTILPVPISGIPGYPPIPGVTTISVREAQWLWQQRPSGPWDYKQSSHSFYQNNAASYNDEAVRYFQIDSNLLPADQLGNFAFGYSGAAIGVPLWRILLYSGAGGFVGMQSDTVEDQDAIREGYKLWQDHNLNFGNDQLVEAVQRVDNVQV